MSSKLSVSERTRDPERSKTAILDAAEALFAQKGFEGVSFAEIGAKAGVSRGTPGYFFGSKEELYRAVLERSMDKGIQVLRSLEPLALEVPLEQGVELAVRGYMGFLLDNPNFMRLVSWEALSEGRFLRESRGNTQVFRGSAAVINQILGQSLPGLSNGVHGMLSLMGLCWFPLANAENLRDALGFDVRAPEHLEAHVQHIIALLLHGIRGQKEGS